MIMYVLFPDGRKSEARKFAIFPWEFEFVGSFPTNAIEYFNTNVPLTNERWSRVRVL